MDPFEHAQRRIAAIIAACLARAIRSGDPDAVEECRMLLARDLQVRIRGG